MRRLYSVYYHYLAILSPAAPSEKVAEGSFLLLGLTLYFAVSFFVHWCEATFDRDFGIVGVMGLSLGIGCILYRLLIAEDNWKSIVAKYPVRAVQKRVVYLYIVLIVVLGLGLIFVPVIFP